MAKKIKIRVSTTVEVDPEAWAEEYSLDTSEVRADVQAYCVDQIHCCHAADSGLLEVKS